MKSIKLLLLVFLIAPNLVLSQSLSIRDAFQESEANLVFVGKADSYGRSYGAKDDSIDGTFATFRIINVLKGKFTDKYIGVRFPGHWGFENGNWIVLATADIKKVARDKKLGNCQESCYYSAWLFRNTKKNNNAVRREIRRRHSK